MTERSDDDDDQHGRKGFALPAGVNGPSKIALGNVETNLVVLAKAGESLQMQLQLHMPGLDARVQFFYKSKRMHTDRLLALIVASNL